MREATTESGETLLDAEAEALIIAIATKTETVIVIEIETAIGGDQARPAARLVTKQERFYMSHGFFRDQRMARTYYQQGQWSKSSSISPR